MRRRHPSQDLGVDDTIVCDERPGYRHSCSLASFSAVHAAKYMSLPILSHPG